MFTLSQIQVRTSDDKTVIAASFDSRIFLAKCNKSLALASEGGNGTVGFRVAKLSGRVHMSALAGSDSSQSSTGYEDGLGRRVLGFDRESGTMLERLILRPELCAFEYALKERIAIVAGLDDERFAKPRTIEHLVNGTLIVISEFVGGRRLSDIIEDAADHSIVAGLDAGLGLLLELLPAVARLHDAGLTHGAIAPGRIMISPAGQILLLDAITPNRSSVCSSRARDCGQNCVSRSRSTPEPCGSTSQPTSPIPPW